MGKKIKILKLRVGKNIKLQGTLYTPVCARIDKWDRDKINLKSQLRFLTQLGLYRILIWPDIRPLLHSCFVHEKVLKSLLNRSSHNLFNRLSRYPANETGYPAGYRISKMAEYPASRISGTTLVSTLKL